MISPMEVYSPKTVEEIVDALKKVGECPYGILAGGTDLLIRSNRTRWGWEAVIDLSKVEELKKISMEDQYLRIGAGVTFSEIAESQLVNTYGKALAESAALVGSPQIRNRATLGGNVANAAPAADGIPSILSLDGEVVLRGQDGSLERLSVEQFMTWEKGRLNRERKFIECFYIPLVSEDRISHFSRIGSRSEVTISKLSLAISYMKSQNGKIQNARVAMGAVGKTACRVPEAEELLNGHSMDEAVIADLGALLSAYLDEKLKGRASVTYKRRAIFGVLGDLYEKMIGA